MIYYNPLRKSFSLLEEELEQLKKEYEQLKSEYRELKNKYALYRELTQTLMKGYISSIDYKIT